MDGELTELIRRPALKKLLGGVSDSSLTRWEAAYGFPPRIKLGSNSVAWDLNAVKRWISTRTKIELEKKHD